MHSGNESLTHSVWLAQDEMMAGIKCQDIIGSLAVARLMLRSYRRSGKIPSYGQMRAVARSVQDRITESLYKELRSRILMMIEDARNRSIEIQPLPFEGRISRERHEFRVAHYEQQFSDLCQKFGGNPMSDDDRCRKGSEARPIVCLTNKRVFHSAKDAARWLNEEGWPRVVAGHIRTSLSRGDRLAGFRWAYADEVGAEMPKEESTKVMSITA